jgi:PAS domain-containing protein
MGREMAESAAKTHRLQNADSYCAMAAKLLGCGNAVLILNQNGVSRVLASAAAHTRFLSYAWSFAEASYGSEARLVLPDAVGNAGVQGAAKMFGLDRIGFFLRCPIATGEGYAVALLVFDAAPGKKPGAAKLKLLAEVEAGLAAEFKEAAALLTDRGADVTTTLPLAAIEAKIAGSTLGKALLDRDLRILAMSRPLAQMLGDAPEAFIGRTHQQVSVPSADAIAFLYKRALETRISPPDCEIVDEGGHVFALTVDPFSPPETRDYFLLVTAREVTDAERRAMALSRRIGADGKPEPSLAFLLETLAARRAIRSRKTANYLTLRSWRNPIRGYQIKALKALKRNIPLGMAAAIAQEIAEEARNLVGFGAFKAIVPMPCGHSEPGSCLSLEIARALSAQIGLPVVTALACTPQKGVSHPKENAKRPPLMLAAKLAEPALLVDDVATSGAHMEEAIKLLKPHCGAVLALAWIGGDAA